MRLLSTRIPPTAPTACQVLVELTVQRHQTHAGCHVTMHRCVVRCTVFDTEPKLLDPALICTGQPSISDLQLNHKTKMSGRVCVGFHSFTSNFTHCATGDGRHFQSDSKDEQPEFHSKCITCVLLHTGVTTVVPNGRILTQE